MSVTDSFRTKEIEDLKAIESFDINRPSKYSFNDFLFNKEDVKASFSENIFINQKKAIEKLKKTNIIKKELLPERLIFTPKNNTATAKIFGFSNERDNSMNKEVDKTNEVEYKLLF